MAARWDADARALEAAAARELAVALAQWDALHGGGKRDIVRRRLGRVVDAAERAIAAAISEGGDDTSTIAGARTTLAKAHAARAEDAFHGAGQLSQSAQRAPTREACDEGWRRVEAIAAGAEESARAAGLIARALEEASAPRRFVADASKAARRAEAAARGARRIVDERNHAYTFHADGAFSFGEGWYVAAAAVLAGVAIQIEPGKAGTRQAERFVRDAGLPDRMQPYRSRARTVRQTTDLVARAFDEDPLGARRKLRAAFLGDEPIARRLVDWIEARFAGAPDRKKVLLWIRDGAHERERNTTAGELAELACRAQGAGLVPIVVGDALPEAKAVPNAIDMTLFWKGELFRDDDMRRAQLQVFEHLTRAHGLVGQVGVTTAGMDGPALMGVPTAYLTDAPNPRMGAWARAVPGYVEIVRDGGYLDRVGDVLRRWADA